MATSNLRKLVDWVQAIDSDRPPTITPFDELKERPWRDILDDVPLQEMAFQLELDASRRAVIARLESWSRTEEAHQCPSYGYICVLLITLESLQETDSRRVREESHPEQQGHDCANICQRLIGDASVRGAVRQIYGGGLGSAARDPARKQWNLIDWDTVQFHRHGTTSFILRGLAQETQGERAPFALKCLLAPFTRLSVVVAATRAYKSRFGIPASTAGAGPNEHAGKSNLVQIWASTARWILMEFVTGDTLEAVLDDLRGTERSPENASVDRSVSGEIRKLVNRARAAVNAPQDADGIRLDLLKSLGGALFDAMAALDGDNRHHGDLVPSNIIVEGYDKEQGLGRGPFRLRLIDFGPNYLYTSVIPGRERPDRIHIAPEVRAGDDPKRESDVYSLGQLLVTVTGARRDADEVIPDRLYAVAAPLARLVEDFVDSDSDFRLKACYPYTSFKQLKEVFDTQLDLVRAAHRLRRVPSDTHWLRGLVRACLPFQGVPKEQRSLALEYWRQRREYKRAGKMQPAVALGPYAAYLAVVAFWCAVAWWITSIVVFTWFFRDLGALSNSMFAWLAGHAGLVPDFLFGPLDALRRPDYHVPPHDQSEMLVNLSARIIGFSFALASAKYYENLIAGVTPLFAAQISARGIRWLALVAEFSSRLLMSWWWMPLILVATLVDARWWPICSAIGMTSVLVANASWALFCQRIVSEAHKDDKKPVGVLPRAIEQVTGLDGFIRWPASMFVYCSVVWTVGLLLEFKVLQDMIVYASCVAVVNIVLFYILRCGRQAAVVRTGLTRIVLAAERLAVRLPTHQRVGSLAPGYAASSTDSPTGT